MCFIYKTIAHLGRPVAVAKALSEFQFNFIKIICGGIHGMFRTVNFTTPFFYNF